MIFHFCKMKAFFLLPINHIHHHSQPPEVHLFRFASGQERPTSRQEWQWNYWVTSERANMEQLPNGTQMRSKVLTRKHHLVVMVVSCLRLVSLSTQDFIKSCKLVYMRNKWGKKIHFLYICSDLTYPVLNTSQILVYYKLWDAKFKFKTSQYLSRWTTRTALHLAITRTAFSI